MTLRLSIPASHPAFAGHFPGSPIVPGVVLLDAAVHAINSELGGLDVNWQIATVKFLKPLPPDVSVEISYQRLDNDSVRFEVRQGTDLVVTGSLLPKSRHD